MRIIEEFDRISETFLVEFYANGDWISGGFRGVKVGHLSPQVVLCMVAGSYDHGNQCVRAKIVHEEEVLQPNKYRFFPFISPHAMRIAAVYAEVVDLFDFPQLTFDDNQLILSCSDGILRLPTIKIIKLSYRIINYDRILNIANGRNIRRNFLIESGNMKQLNAIIFKHLQEMAHKHKTSEKSARVLYENSLNELILNKIKEEPFFESLGIEVVDFLMSTATTRNGLSEEAMRINFSTEKEKKHREEIDQQKHKNALELVSTEGKIAVRGLEAKGTLDIYEDGKLIKIECWQQICKSSRFIENILSNHRLRNYRTNPELHGPEIQNIIESDMGMSRELDEIINETAEINGWRQL